MLPKVSFLKHTRSNGVDSLIEAIDAEVEKNNGEKWVAMLKDPISTAAEDGRVKGRAEGREEGMVEGQDRYAKLADALMDAGRLDDLRAASSHHELRERLYAEFGI